MNFIEDVVVEGQRHTARRRWREYSVGRSIEKYHSRFLHEFEVLVGGQHDERSVEFNSSTAHRHPSMFNPNVRMLPRDDE